MVYSLTPRIRSAVVGAGAVRTCPHMPVRFVSQSSIANTAVEQQVTPSSSSSSSSTPATTATTHYRITLRRSAIGLPAAKRRVIESLGLRRRLGTVYREHSADIAGAVLEIKELLHVENVRRLDGGVEEAARTMAEEVRRMSQGGEEAVAAAARLDAMPPLAMKDWEAIWVNAEGEVVDWGGRQARKAPRGFTVVGNVANEARHRSILASKDEKA